MAHAWKPIWILMALALLALLSWWVWERGHEVDHEVDHASRRPQPDAMLVVGGGLAGCVVSLELARRGYDVALYERAADLGGNSALASSGINGAGTSWQKASGIKDSVPLFATDTARSSGASADTALIKHLTQESAGAINWLHEQGVALDQVVRLGGHTQPRTHRDSTQMAVGSAIMSTLIAQVDSNPSITVHRDTAVAALLAEQGRVTGLILADGVIQSGKAVILCCGGFAANHAWIETLRPDLRGYPTTSGRQAQGEFMRSVVDQFGGVDLDQIQVHPTGFVDPQQPTLRHKHLAAEILRGVGGQLLNAAGQRFCDELDTRQAIYERMLAQAAPQRHFTLVVPRSGYAQARKHIDFYVSKGLLRVTPQGYEGTVTPVVHYCQGGLRFNRQGQVLDRAGDTIAGLWAAGEVTGGLHGHNRLGGNSLLECVVFGRTIAQAFPSRQHDLRAVPRETARNITAGNLTEKRLTMAKVKKHNTVDDCWVVIKKRVYEVPAAIARNHPHGVFPAFAGQDVTLAFGDVHSDSMLQRLVLRGVLESE